MTGSSGNHKRDFMEQTQSDEKTREKRKDKGFIGEVEYLKMQIRLFKGRCDENHREETTLK